METKRDAETRRRGDAAKEDVRMKIVSIFLSASPCRRVSASFSYGV
jgi:hypothetical protein